MKAHLPLLGLSLLLTLPSPAQADTVLTPRTRKLFTTVEDGNQLKSGDSYRAFLDFGSDNKPDTVDVGVAAPTGNGWNAGLEVSVTRESFANLEARHRGQVGRLRVENLSRKKKLKLHEKVLVGGSTFDADCRYPVLLSDFHSTLNQQVPDRCTQSSLTDLHRTFPGLTTVVVSTTGESIEGEMRNTNLRFGEHEQMIILPSSRLGYGGEEKAARVALSFMNAGFCLVGIVGETPEKEGKAARILDIPYFGVHGSAPSRQEWVDTTPKEEEKKDDEDRQEEEKKPEEKKPESGETKKTPALVSLPGGGTKIIFNDKPVVPEVVSGGATMPTYPPMPRGSDSSSSSGKDSSKQPKQQVRSGYYRTVTLPWAPRNMQEFPSGSVDAQSWCELGPKIHDRIRVLEKGQ